MPPRYRYEKALTEARQDSNLGGKNFLESRQKYYVGISIHVLGWVPWLAYTLGIDRGLLNAEQFPTTIAGGSRADTRSLRLFLSA